MGGLGREELSCLALDWVVSDEERGTPFPSSEILRVEFAGYHFVDSAMGLKSRWALNLFHARWRLESMAGKMYAYYHK